MMNNKTGKLFIVSNWVKNTKVLPYTVLEHQVLLFHGYENL